MKDKRIIAQVREGKSQQRRVTVPKEDQTLTEGDFVELKKLDLK